MNTWMDTQEKVFAYIREHHMLQAGDRVVAGVSGGADSVCLLFLLLEWQKEVPTDIAVVHVDHGIRAEAGADARNPFFPDQGRGKEQSPHGENL